MIHNDEITVSGRIPYSEGQPRTRANRGKRRCDVRWNDIGWRNCQVAPNVIKRAFGRAHRVFPSGKQVACISPARSKVRLTVDDHGKRASDIGFLNRIH